MGSLDVQTLAVTRHSTQLAGQEVIRGPRAAYSHFAVLKLLGGRRVTVLVFFDALGVDQMGDVDQHALRRDLLAADFLLERVEELVYLNGKGPGLSLAFALAGGLDPELGEVVATDGVWQLNVDHSLAQGTVAHDELDVHFGLAAELGHAQTEGAPVDPDGLAEGVIALENGPEFKRKYGGVAEAVADYSCVLDCRFLVQFTGCVVVFAYDHGEFTTWIA